MNTSATLVDHQWSTHLEENTGTCITEADIIDHFPTASHHQIEHATHKPIFPYRTLITSVSLASSL